MTAMPTPKLLTPDEFPTICPVFRAASHGEALDLADYHFRQDGVEAALWYREPIGLDWDLINEDRQLFKDACKKRSIQIDIDSRESTANNQLGIHYDGYYGVSNPQPCYFMGTKIRTTILRTPFNELGTIIFDQGIGRYDDFGGYSQSKYKTRFGSPWQAGSHSILFLKSKHLDEFQAVLHTAPIYNLIGQEYKRHIDVIDLDCSEAIRPSLPLPLPPIA